MNTIEKKLILWLTIFVAGMLPLTSYAESWVKVPMISEDMRNRQIEGGEGCQWVQGLAVSRTNPDFLIMGTDVMGVYVSRDGGKSWDLSIRGFKAPGAHDFAIDPYNENRVLAVGGGGAWDETYFSRGIYLSTDGARTWTQVQPDASWHFRDFRQSIVYDESSYDERLGYCTTAYWSTFNDCYPGLTLFKTTDGGQTWNKLDNTERFGKSSLAVHPAKGYLYTAGADGFSVSRDGGKTFKRTFELNAEEKLSDDEEFTTLAVTPLSPDEVYLASNWKLFKSTDCGQTFKEIIPEKTVDIPRSEKEYNASFNTKGYSNLTISPIDKNKLYVCSAAWDYCWHAWYSEDGGITWNKTQYNSKDTFYPFNVRQKRFAPHPTDPNVIFYTGGDTIMKSSDGGRTMRFSGSGYLGSFSHSFSINSGNPDYMYCASKDYAGAVSFDGGYSWEYTNVENTNWGGLELGGYVVDRDTIVASRQGGRLYVTHSGPAMFEPTDLYLTGIAVRPNFGAPFYAVPNNQDIVFAGQYRSTDRCYKWEIMTGCGAVLTHDRSNGTTLFGLNNDGSAIVKSDDDGATWQTVYDSVAAGSKQEFCDLSYDPVNKCIYAAASWTLFKYHIDTKKLENIGINLKRDSLVSNFVRVYDVAVDPVDTNVVYAAGSNNQVYVDVSLQRSLDGGKTWDVITPSSYQSIITDGVQAAGSCYVVRVHPETRYVYAGGGYCGYAKLAPPGQEEEPGKEISVSKAENGLKIKWFDNGQTTLEDVAKQAYMTSAAAMDSVPMRRRVYYDMNTDARLNAQDVDLQADYLFDEWDKEKTPYAVYRSTDGESFDIIVEHSEGASYTDTSVESGVKYYYRVKNLKTGEFSKTAFHKA